LPATIQGLQAIHYQYLNLKEKVYFLKAKTAPQKPVAATT
jgi:hypothetical protein